MFCRCHRHHYWIVEHCETKKSRPILNFARFDSLVCIVARSREKSRSLSLAPFLARCRSLSLSFTGLPSRLRFTGPTGSLSLERFVETSTCSMHPVEGAHCTTALRAGLVVTRVTYTHNTPALPLSALSLAAVARTAVPTA